jgi:integrase
LNQYFDVVKQARIWLKSQVEVRTTEKTRVPSETTVKGYRLEMVRLAKSGDPWKAAADTTKKATFFRRRAAILHFCRERVSAHLKAQDDLQRGNGLLDPVRKEAWLKEVASLKNALNLAEKAPDGPPMEKVERRETKRKDLWKLPESWREVMVDRMPKYRAAVAVSALSGCRPVELERGGVVVSVRDGVLKLRIGGAKIGEHSGQEWRELSWKLPSNNPLAIIVGRMALENKGEMLVKIDSSKAFSGAMRSAGRRAFPGFSEEITPYSMRHQASSDMKAAGLGDEVSAALGHSASDTKGSYGSFELGNGAMAPDQVEAARSIKHKLFEPQRPRVGLFGP